MNNSKPIIDEAARLTRQARSNYVYQRRWKRVRKIQDAVEKRAGISAIGRSWNANECMTVVCHLSSKELLFLYIFCNKRPLDFIEEWISALRSEYESRLVEKAIFETKTREKK